MIIAKGLLSLKKKYDVDGLRHILDFSRQWQYISQESLLTSSAYNSIGFRMILDLIIQIFISFTDYYVEVNGKPFYAL